MDLGDGRYLPTQRRRGIASMSVFPSVERVPEASTYIHSVEDLTLSSPRRIAMSSSDPSADPPSIFDTDDNDPDASSSASSRTSNGFDLMPPPPNVTLTNAEVLSVRLFSTDHLNLIIHHQPLFSQFIAFLNEYRPNHAPTLIRYLETLKAAAAVDYANAIAKQLVGPEKTSSATLVAATLSSKFGSGSRRVAEQLVNEALPAYITFRLTNVVTELLVNEITGCRGGIRNLVSGLAEAYCLTDPSRPGNPIVYASEGFHTTTLYGKDFVLGRNCRFLQGPKSSRATIARFSAAVRNGQESSELLLNYRRDGSPFLNLCLISPLHDNRGNVRYFIGCQIDVTNLVEGCQGLESFHMLLDQDQRKHQQEASVQQQEKDALEALGRLGELLSLEEMETIRSKGRPGSDSRSATPARGNLPLASNSQLRRYISVEDSGEAGSARLRATNRLKPSGRFPNAYETFMLVRPYPSLRITFTSPALRIPGLLQSRLLDRIGGPTSVREYIRTALADGARITAKVNWLTNSGHRKSPSLDRAGRPRVDIHGQAPPHYSTGKPRWIHCTPLYGADGNVGVWMVVMIEPDEDETQYSSYSGGYQQSVSHRARRNQSIDTTRSDSSTRVAHATAAPVSGRKAPSPAPSHYPQRAAPNLNETLSALRYGDTRLDHLSSDGHSQSESPLPSFQASRATPHLINTSHASSKNTNYGPASAHHSSAAARAIFDHHHGQHYHDSHSASGVRRSRSLTTTAITMGTAITTNSPVPAPSYYPPPVGYPPKPPTHTIDELTPSAAPPSRTGTPAFTLTDQLSPHNRPAFTPSPTLPSSKASSPAPGRPGLREECGTDGNTAEDASGNVTLLAGGGAGTPANTPRRGGYDVDDDDGRAGRSVMAPSRSGSISTSSTSLRTGRLTPVTAGSSGLLVRTPSTGRSLVRGAKEKDRERKREREMIREHEAEWEQQQQHEAGCYHRHQQQQQQQGRDSPLTITTAQRSRADSSAQSQSPAAADNRTGVVPKKVEWVKGLHRQASTGSSSGGGRSKSPATPTTALPLPPPPPIPRSPGLVREKSKRGGLSSILASSKSSLKGATALKDKLKDKPLDKGKEKDRGADRELSNTSRERRGGGAGTRTPTPTLGTASTERSGSAAGYGSSENEKGSLTALPAPPLPPPLAPPREPSPRLEVRLSGLGKLDVDDEEALLGL